MPTPEHNPQSIPPSEIPPGWRLCRESEREKLPADAKFLTYLQGQPNWWKDSCCQEKSPEDWAWKEYTYITATPLPESEREVPAASPWIPLSERAPVESDWDAAHVVEAANSGWREVANKFMPQPWCGNYTHWRRVELPPLPAPPPTPAKTQREKDKETLYKWLNRPGITTIGDTYYAALETERTHFGGRSAEEVATKIKEILEWDTDDRGYIPQAVRDLFSPPQERETK